MRQPDEFLPILNQYVADILSGKIVACKHAKNACRRHLRDIERSDGDWLYVFDAEKAGRACAFMEKLPHVKGEWARKDTQGQTQRMVLSPWQVFVVGSIFGWVNKTTGLRRFSRASIYVPRKNGKSFFGAGIGLRMFAFDNEPGAEVYSGATSLKQSMEVFRPAKQIVKKEKALRDIKGIDVRAMSMIREEEGSRFEPVIGQPGDGASPHCAIIDEFHEHTTDELVATMQTGMGARKQPLLLIISTAGSLIEGPCRADWRMCEELLAGKFEADDTFAIIFSPDPADPWDSDEAVLKANPNFDVSVYGSYLKSQREHARRDPRARANYETKNLNRWVNAKAGMFDLSQWAALKEDIGQYFVEGAKVYGGLDMMMRHDICSLVLDCPLDGGRHALKCFNFLPRKTIYLPEKQHYRAWKASGHIIEAGEAVIDHEIINTHIEAIRKKYQLTSLEYDPAHTLGFITPLVSSGIQCVDAYAGFKMPEKTRDFVGLYMGGKIIHDGDPVLEWAISNCVEKTSRRGMPMLDKESNDRKIDPAVSAVMAIGGALRDAAEPVSDAGVLWG